MRKSVNNQVVSPLQICDETNGNCGRVLMFNIFLKRKPNIPTYKHDPEKEIPVLHIQAKKSPK